MSVGPFTRRSILSAAAALAASPAVIAPARAQSDFPNRPIHLIVGFAAGGGNDIFARLVGAKLSEILGQPVIVENKPGAGGRLAPEYVTQQAADGYTLVRRAKRRHGDRGRDLSRSQILSDQELRAARHDREFSIDLGGRGRQSGK